MADNTQIITLEEYHRREDNMEGICTSCNATAHGIEPDADGYECPSCEEPTVQGIMTALENGHVLLEDDSG
jgi:rubrerythrin